jgi:hypothetical protein
MVRTNEVPVMRAMRERRAVVSTKATVQWTRIVARVVFSVLFFRTYLDSEEEFNKYNESQTTPTKIVNP